MQKNSWNRRQRSLIVTAILLVFILLDQAIKVWVRGSYPLVGPHNFFFDTINYVYVENPGAFLSLGANLSDGWRFFIFSVVVGIGLGFVVWHLYRVKEASRLYVWGLSLIIAGGIGNLIDRVFRGTVTDYLVMGMGSLRTGVFNLADFIIVIGSVLLVWEQWKLNQQTKK